MMKLTDDVGGSGQRKVMLLFCVAVGRPGVPQSAEHEARTGTSHQRLDVRGRPRQGQ